MAAVSLELLQSMVQRVLDEQKNAHQERESMLQRFSGIEHRFSRMERIMLTVLRAQLDKADSAASLQEQIDRVVARVDRLETQHS